MSRGKIYHSGLTIAGSCGTLQHVMDTTYRAWFFRIFAAFYLIVTPFLIIYSLGYEVDFQEKQLTNTLSINIETTPWNADIFNDNQLIRQGSGELLAREDQLIPLSVQAPEYLGEDFLLWSPSNQNSTARITNLWLLPTQPQILESTQEQYRLISLLSPNQALIQYQNQYFVQLYSFGGLQGGMEPINLESPLLQINNQPWEILPENTFWQPQTNYLLTRIAGQWTLTDLNQLPFQPLSVISASADSLYILDNRQNLWHLQLVSKLPTFIDSQVNGLTFTASPDTVWVWKNSEIYRIARGQAAANLNLSEFVYAEFPNLPTQSPNSSHNFKVSNLFQGIFLKINSTGYYIPDFDKSSYQVLTPNLTSYVTEGNTIFWLDQNKYLFGYNLFLRQRQSFGQMNFEDNPLDTRLRYYSPWRRLLVYTPTKVISTWYDKDIINQGVVGYYPKTWIDQSSCYPGILDRYQFCIRENSLIAYRNTNIW